MRVHPVRPGPPASQRASAASSRQRPPHRTISHSNSPTPKESPRTFPRRLPPPQPNPTRANLLQIRPHRTPRPPSKTVNPIIHRAHPPKTSQTTVPSDRPGTTPPAARHGVPAEQQPHRHPQLRHLPALRPDPRRGHLAGPPRRRHRVRALPLRARHRRRRLPPRRLPRGARRRLLPRHLAALGLPPRHVRPHRRRLLPHRLRLRRHQPRRRGGRVGPRVQGVPPRGLLQLAAEARGEHQELEQDQELPPGLQGLQEHAGEEGDVRGLHALRPLTHRVRLLQAPHQLQLHLRERHGLDQDPHELGGPGLRHLEQRGALLRLPVLQGRRGGHLQARLEARRRRQRRLPRLHHHRLLRRMLRVPEQPQGQRLPRRLEGRLRLILSMSASPCVLREPPPRARLVAVVHDQRFGALLSLARCPAVAVVLYMRLGSI